MLEYPTQAMDMHEEAIPSLAEALKNIDPDEPPLSYARLHYAIAQVRKSTK